LDIKIKTNKFSLWLPVLIWAAIIFILSSISIIKVTDLNFIDFLTKKSAHVVEYAILFGLIHRATKGKLLVSFIVCLIYAISDEYHQSFVIGRSASVIDIIIDLSGINIAAFALWRSNQIQSKKQ